MYKCVYNWKRHNCRAIYVRNYLLTYVRTYVRNIVRQDRDNGLHFLLIGLTYPRDPGAAASDLGCTRQQYPWRITWQNSEYTHKSRAVCLASSFWVILATLHYTSVSLNHNHVYAT